MNEIRTAMQKKITEHMIKMKGRCSQPNARRIERNMISTGKVTSMRVIMTRRGLGPGGPFTSILSEDEGSIESELAAEWRAVDSLETNIEPALPGRPVY